MCNRSGIQRDKAWMLVHLTTAAGAATAAMASANCNTLYTDNLCGAYEKYACEGLVNASYRRQHVCC